MEGRGVMMRIERIERIGHRLARAIAVYFVLLAIHYDAALGAKEAHAARVIATAEQRKILHEAFVRNFIGITKMRESRLAELAKQQQSASVKSVSCATGCEFSYVSKGSSGLYSGDFFDLVMLDDDHLLVRFGDVMGHDRLAASVALALVAGFHDRETLALLRSFYLHEDKGQQQALNLLSDALYFKNTVFYTLADSVIDLRSRQVSSLFLGSDYFMRVRKTGTQEQQKIEVDKVGSKDASLPFVLLASDTPPTHKDFYLDATPHVYSYVSGEYLVYISDGLLGRMIGDEMVSMTSVAEQLIAEAFEEIEDFTDVATTIHDKILAASIGYEPDDITVLVIKLP